MVQMREQTQGGPHHPRDGSKTHGSLAVGARTRPWAAGVEGAWLLQGAPPRGNQLHLLYHPQANGMQSGCPHHRPRTERETEDIDLLASQCTGASGGGVGGQGGRPTCAAAPVCPLLPVQDQGEHHQQDDDQAAERHHQEEPPLLVERGFHLS